MSERADAAIPEILAFAEVAQTGSFTRAANNLETSKSNVGKAVQRLENRLGTRLFQRTTRVVRLTEDGETYLRAAQTALNSLQEAEQVLAARKAEPIGRVRVDLPAGFGRLLLPSLGEFRKKYPKVTLELSFTDRTSDAVGEGWDIVVRIGELPSDSEMTVRKFCHLRFGLYASPAYIASHGEIATAADLIGKEALLFRGAAGRLRSWTVQDGDQMRDISPTPVMIVSDGQALIELTMEGLGISQLIDRVADPYVEKGRLVKVLPSADIPGPPVHGLIPLGQKMSSATRAVLNHLAESFK